MWKQIKFWYQQAMLSSKPFAGMKKTMHSRSIPPRHIALRRPVLFLPVGDYADVPYQITGARATPILLLPNSKTSCRYSKEGESHAN
jgi:hypothetical protein